MISPSTISPSLLAEVRPLAERFAAAGFRIYLVGGIVRDQLLGRTLSLAADIDLTTDAAPGSIKRLVAPMADAVWSQGERFGTIGCRIGSRDYEITTHRGESYESHSRKPMVVFSSELLHDLERRDFTINAMAVEVPVGQLFDPFGGQHDLRRGTLRTPLAPAVSFSDDPLRMLRAARFISGYGLTADARLVAAIRPLADRMAIVSVERRRDELDKLLSVEDPSPGFWFLRQHELIEFVLPTLVDIDEATFGRVLESVRALPPTRGLRLAALLSTHVDGRLEVEAHVRNLRYGNDVVAEVSATVAGASDIWMHGGRWVDVDARRLAATTGKWLDAAITLASTRADTRQLTELVARLRSTEDLDDLRPALDGAAVMALLRLAPGVEVGEALAFLRELRIVEGPLARDEAARRLTEWWDERPSV